MKCAMVLPFMIIMVPLRTGVADVMKSFMNMMFYHNLQFSIYNEFTMIKFLKF